MVTESTLGSEQREADVGKGAKQKTTVENAAQMADKAERWVASPEGQQAVEEKLIQAREVARKFREAQRVDPDVLDKPVTR